MNLQGLYRMQFGTHRQAIKDFLHYMDTCSLIEKIEPLSSSEMA